MRHSLGLYTVSEDESELSRMASWAGTHTSDIKAKSENHFQGRTAPCCPILVNSI